MPHVPMVFLPHPVAGTPEDLRESLAARVASQCIALLEGRTS